ncbi:winged helix-turn-helix transcriptional regulator [Nocardia alba]|uniref:HxlR family transcriptional regulator n=1 Tax=Nocardia alba TaxID=225051 RepID=A0A4R1FMK9_9NOCA|nr:helix-turn-helix domain-containing protein [Nocardia alba]TCJ95330.1 HxlR family transcriptional regulator [Nocardia alba]
MDTVSDDQRSVEAFLRDCPARQLLTVLADKWVLLVLGSLREAGEPVRFNALRRRLDGITQKVLTRTLRDLERDGLVRREVFPTMPPRVEYSITALGADLGRISQAMGAWVVEHHAQITAARTAFDAARAAEPAPLAQPGRAPSPVSK